MSNRSQAILEIKPNVTERVSGGWMAIAPSNAPICIGVFGASEDEAREKFSKTIKEWALIFNEDQIRRGKCKTR